MNFVTTKIGLVVKSSAVPLLEPRGAFHIVDANERRPRAFRFPCPHTHRKDHAERNALVLHVSRSAIYTEIHPNFGNNLKTLKRIRTEDSTLHKDENKFKPQSKF